MLRVKDLTLFAVIFRSRQMSGRDIEERSDIFERKEGEDVGVSADKFIVPLLWILDIQST